MRSLTIARMVALSLCLMLAVPGVALSASFGEFTSGVKTLTGAAKDVKDMNSEKQETKAAPAAQSKKQQKSTKAQSKPKKEERVRGG